MDDLRGASAARLGARCDAAQWVAVGMRFYEPRPATARARRRIRPVVTVAQASSERRVRVVAPGAHTVELMADFTDWAR